MDRPHFDGVSELIFEFPQCEHFILHDLAELDLACRNAYNAFDFATVARKLVEFASGPLSTFYLDVTKDTLYSDLKDSAKRVAALSTMSQILRTTTSILAPIAPHLAEEIHHFRQLDSDPEVGDQHTSVFAEGWHSPVSIFVSLCPADR